MTNPYLTVAAFARPADDLDETPDDFGPLLDGEDESVEPGQALPFRDEPGDAGDDLVVEPAPDGDNDAVGDDL